MLAHDEYGYGRNPAFWFTLNCPYNYLHEIHRFQGNLTCLDPTTAEAKRMRFQWCLDNPYIVCFLHAVRVRRVRQLFGFDKLQCMSPWQVRA